MWYSTGPSNDCHCQPKSEPQNSRAFAGVAGRNLDVHHLSGHIASFIGCAAKPAPRRLHSIRRTSDDVFDTGREVVTIV